MEFKRPLPKRPRLHGYDYAASGCYLATVVTRLRACTLSHIVGFEILLSDLGKLVEEHLCMLPERFSHVSVDSHVIMPNHVHALLRFDDSIKSVNLSRVINELKSRTTVRYNKLANKHGTVWQYGYYDTIIRSDRHLFSARQYIENNPLNWELDELNPESS